MVPNECVPGIERTQIARVGVDNIPSDSLPDAVEQMITNGEYHHFVFLRTWDLLRARRNPQFRQYVRNASFAIPSSPGVARSAHFLKRPALIWYSPFEFVVRLLGVLEQRNRSVYLLGGDRHQLHNVEQNVKLTFPGVRIVGRYTGHYPKGFERNIVTAIKKASPDFLLVGSGVPGRDLWVFTHRKLFNPGLAVFSEEVFDIFGDRRSKPAKTSGGRLLESVKTVVRKPWRVFRAPVYVWFGLVLLFVRLRGR